MSTLSLHNPACLVIIPGRGLSVKHINMDKVLIYDSSNNIIYTREVGVDGVKEIYMPFNSPNTIGIDYETHQEFITGFPFIFSSLK